MDDITCRITIGEDGSILIKEDGHGWVLRIDATSEVVPSHPVVIRFAEYMKTTVEDASSSLNKIRKMALEISDEKGTA